ncbi:transcriptional regulator with XRE-family HTH domain [Microvirga flocculans]|uniref:Transcriptional regulator with XRE-family HTH domain n=1 Tax=Microvirga flocculans TaxID=217168 RepID=A0A7W6N9L9_9HYPH|nr:helix-turn-helix transcriptional regulator [Microvirga flocculans]MBB4041640.1 transcriptional regulator with XRE-family HTH domain [Microvirga flocculans]
MTKKKPSARDEEIGRRIRARRASIGMSQSVLGEKLGVTFQQVQKYEKGINRIGSGRLEELARVLNVPITFFYDEVEPNEGDPNSILGLANTVQAFRLLKAFSTIESSDTRQAIVNLVVQIASGGTGGDKTLQPSKGT